MKLALLCVATAPLWAQTLTVYSEFAHIGASGDVIAPEMPREILSPAMARNAYTSFQLVVQAEAGKQWRLYAGLNPENSVRLTLYRESGDALERVDLPLDSSGTQVFWMDVWTDRNAPVRRIKIEPELFIDTDWVVYPMEARVMGVTVPGEPRQPSSPPVDYLRAYLCPTRKVTDREGPNISVAGLRSRNTEQDAALAALAPKDELKKLFGACDAKPPENPEWYLRIRDYLFRLR